MVLPPSSLPLAAAGKGALFSDFIRNAFGCSVADGSPDLACFSLIVAFGRCRSKLSDEFAASCSLLSWVVQRWTLASIG